MPSCSTRPGPTCDGASRDRALDRGKPPPPSDNGDGRHEDPEVNEAADDPHRLARIYLDKHCKHKGRRTLVFYRGEFHRWENSAYRPVSDQELNVGANRTAKAEFDRLNRIAHHIVEIAGRERREGELLPGSRSRKVSTRLIGDMRQAYVTMTFLPERLEPPAWLIDNPPFPAADVVPFRNGLVHLPSRSRSRAPPHATSTSSCTRAARQPGSRWRSSSPASKRRSSR